MSENNQLSLLLKINLEIFVTKHLELLDLEKDAEIEENKCLQELSSLKSLQKKGLCVPKLRFSRSKTGLFGRSLFYFQSYWGDKSLPSHTISTGDIVGVGNCTADGKLVVITSGIVIRVSDTSIVVAFEKNSDFSEIERDVQYIIVKLANDVTHKRLKRGLKTLHSKGQNYHLVDVLFGNSTPSAIEEDTFDNITFFNNNLNDDQKEAVCFSLKQKELAIIHGPPGTGKTTTVVECILQSVSQKLKVIACAPSNIAVDNLMEKLSVHNVKMVRLGHPARFLTNIQQYSLDAIVSKYDGSNVVDELHSEIDKLREKIEKTKGSKSRKSLWGENKSLLKEVKEREKFIVKQVLKNADVVLCTLTSGSDDGPLKYLEGNHFDLCFIDECSQAIEAACWIPLQLVKKCILAGDHNQLPPTIISKKAAKEGLELTLMERLLKLYGNGIKKMLTIQYRMNEIIMQWPSDQLYDGKLKAHPTVQSHLLNDLPNVENNEDTSVPLLVIDTNACGLQELQVEEDDSKGNEGEADLVAIHVENLIKSGVYPYDIAVITPYNLQVELIKSRIGEKYPKLEVKSVDGFQGREKEAIVLSLVRSNDLREVGFLSEDRRINVAITRAKRHLAVICDSKTVSCHPFLKSLLAYCEIKGEVRSAFQYEAEIGHYPSAKAKQVVTSSKKEKKIPIEKKKPPLSSKKDPQFGHKVQNVDRDIQREEDRRFTEEKYNEIIESFLKSKKMQLSFPSTLSAFERRIVHEIAENLGITHVSSGEGTDRYIELKKKIQPAEFNAIHTESTSTLIVKTQNKFESIEDKKTGNSLEIKNTNDNSKPLIKVNSNKPTTSKAKKLAKTKVKNVELETDQVEGADDFDLILEQVMKADRTCNFEKCKQCVAVLSQVCDFCKKRFCFSHAMPEIHGCGVAAKAQARAQIRKEGVLYAGSGRPQKKIDPIKQSYLQKKLDKKIGELSTQRKPKPKD